MPSIGPTQQNQQQINLRPTSRVLRHSPKLQSAELYPPCSAEDFRVGCHLEQADMKMLALGRALHGTGEARDIYIIHSKHERVLEASSVQILKCPLTHSDMQASVTSRKRPLRRILHSELRLILPYITSSLGWQADRSICLCGRYSSMYVRV